MTLEIHAVKQSGKIEDSRFEEMLALVTEQEKTRIRRFLKWGDRQRALIASILTRNLICQKLKLNYGQIAFVKNKYGKPYLKNNPGLYFNNSHSGEWVVCAAGPAELGIDVEKIRPRGKGVAKRFFSQEEHAALMSQPEEKRAEYFFDLWTLKESYIKAIGRGLSMPLSKFTIRIGTDAIELKNPEQNTHFSFRQYALDPAYKLSICVEGEIGETKINLQSVDEIVENSSRYQPRSDSAE